MLTPKDRTKDRLQASMTMGILKVCADGNRHNSERLTPSGLGTRLYPLAGRLHGRLVFKIIKIQ